MLTMPGVAKTQDALRIHGMFTEYSSLLSVTIGHARLRKRCFSSQDCVLLCSVDGAVRVSQAVSLAIGHIRAHGRFRRYFLHYALIGPSDD